MSAPPSLAKLLEAAGHSSPGAAPGLPAPGSYPHPGAPGQVTGVSGVTGQMNGDNRPSQPSALATNNLQDHLQQQKVRLSCYQSSDLDNVRLQSLPETLSSLKSLAQQALGSNNNNNVPPGR